MTDNLLHLGKIGHKPHDKAYVNDNQTTSYPSSKVECNTVHYKFKKKHSPLPLDMPMQWYKKQGRLAETNQLRKHG